MAESIVKEVSIQENNQKDTNTGQSASEPMPTFKGVSMDLMRHFGIDMSSLTYEARDKLIDIYKLLDGNDLGDKFRTLSEIELKIGRNATDSRMHKVWNWLKIHNNIRTQRAKLDALEAS